MTINRLLHLGRLLDSAFYKMMTVEVGGGNQTRKEIRKSERKRKNEYESVGQAGKREGQNTK